MRDELTKLLDRWQEKTGEPMPCSILRLPIDRIRRAVELTEAGVTVFVPFENVTVPADNSDSMADWDRQDCKNGNAYGG